jgi:hypothetical protein
MLADLKWIGLVLVLGAAGLLYIWLFSSGDEQGA